MIKKPLNLLSFLLALFVAFSVIPEAAIPVTADAPDNAIEAISPNGQSLEKGTWLLVGRDFSDGGWTNGSRISGESLRFVHTGGDEWAFAPIALYGVASAYVNLSNHGSDSGVSINFEAYNPDMFSLLAVSGQTDLTSQAISLDETDWASRWLGFRSHTQDSNTTSDATIQPVKLTLIPYQVEILPAEAGTLTIDTVDSVVNNGQSYDPDRATAEVFRSDSLTLSIRYAPDNPHGSIAKFDGFRIQNGDRWVEFRGEDVLTLALNRHFFETPGILDAIRDGTITIQPIFIDPNLPGSNQITAPDSTIRAPFEALDRTDSIEFGESTVTYSDSGAYSQTKLIDLQNGQQMLFFIGNDDSREIASNQPALYYSLNDGSGWSTPEMVHNDGTWDGFPEISFIPAIGGGSDKLFIAWSDMDRVFDGSEDEVTRLSAMNISAKWYDIASGILDADETLITKTTTVDFYVDTHAKASYDPITHRLMVYYKKHDVTEGAPYPGDDEDDLLSRAYASIVYRYADYTDGNFIWNTAYYSYNEDIGEEEYYGQRFLILGISTTLTETERMDQLPLTVSNEADIFGTGNLTAETLSTIQELSESSTKNEDPRIIDYSVFYYNGYAVFIYTVDDDRDLRTTDDKMLYMQLYDYTTNSFTQPIIITPDKGNISSPQVINSDNASYLFWLDNGSIVYADLSYIIDEGLGEVELNIDINSFTFYYLNKSDKSLDAYHEIAVSAQSDAPIDAYSVTSDGDKLYLVWEQKQENNGTIQSNLFASYYSPISASQASGDETHSWTSPMQITFDEGQNKDSLSVLANSSDGLTLAYVAYDETVAGGADASSRILTVETFTPAEKPRVTDITILNKDSAVRQGFANVELTADNLGLLPIEGAAYQFYIRQGDNEIYTGDWKPILNQFGGDSIIGGTSYVIAETLDLPQSDPLCTIGCRFNGAMADAVVATAVEKAPAPTIVFPTVTETVTYGTALSSVLLSGGSTQYGIFAWTDTSPIPTVINSGYEVTFIPSAQTLAIYQPITDTTEVVPVTVSPLAITVTADNQGKVYGDVDPVLTWQSSPALIGNDVLTGSLVYNGDLPGEYDIVEDVAFTNPNYSVTYVKGTMIIHPQMGSAVISILSPEDVQFDAVNRTIRKSVPNSITQTTLNVVVSENATWKLYTDAACTNEIPNAQMTLAAGVNTAYLKVTAQDGDTTSIYTVSITRAYAEIIIPNYTVNFDTDNGNKVNSQWVVEYGKVVEPTDPVKENYTFDGWYSDPDFTAAYDFNSSVLSSFTLYAKWTAIVEEDENEPKEWDGSPFVSGYPDGSFRPDNRITKAEVTQILYTLFHGDNDGDTNYLTNFSDVEKTHWAVNGLAWAVDNNYLNGYPDGTVKPDHPITRAELATLLYRVANKLELFDIDETERVQLSDIAGHWAYDAISALSKQGIVTGYDDGEFKPEQAVTRAEAVTMITRLLGIKIPVETSGVSFSDVPDSHWAYAVIMLAVNGWES